MENATKALLIAAAVLVTIVLIGLGIRVVGTVGDSSKHTKEVSESIDETTNKAALSVTEILSK